MIELVLEDAIVCRHREALAHLDTHWTYQWKDRAGFAQLRVLDEALASTCVYKGAILSICDLEQVQLNGDCEHALVVHVVDDVQDSISSNVWIESELA